nr:ubiquitin-like modifier-activating enzyme 1 [Rhipicephalus microplus]
MATSNDGDADTNPPAKRRRTDDDTDVDSSASAKNRANRSDSTAHNTPYIDEDFYSRQLYVLGRDAMELIAQSDVLISGLGGLGVEVAKNVIMAGVRSVTLHDDTVCTRVDLSSQYYLNEENVGQNRAEACEEPLARLNEYVRVTSHTEPLNAEFLRRFNVAVLTETPLDEQESIAVIARRNNVALIVADTRGLAGQIFCDFGDSFRVTDTNGEQPLSVPIGSITKEKEGVVTCLDETRHGFQDGDHVTFSEVKGMNEINTYPPMKVKVLSPTEFSVGDTTQFGDYSSGGVATQVKMPKDVKFKPFEESMVNPDFVVSDFAKLDRPAQLHLGFQALHVFELYCSRPPKPWNKEDAETVVTLAKNLNATMATPLETVDEELITTLSCVSAGSLCPMHSIIGSIAAQEVLKACSGKFNPIQQWFYFDAFECLPQDVDVLESDAIAMEHSRYAGQARVFGRSVQKLLMTQTYFVVGAGAVGCELLKNFAMMGIGVDDGYIYVSDMDVVQRSDLNTQFLLRSQDVGASKSVMAGQTIVEINDDINLAVSVDKVAPETSTCSDDFFESLDGVAIAVDNVETRHYMDQCCVHYGKPLIDSGIMGTKGSVQVVVPKITETYSASKDPPDKLVPADAIKHFPSSIEHILLWAREEYDVLFERSAANSLQCLEDPKFLPRALEALQLKEKVALVREIKDTLVDGQASVFDDCVSFARLRFQEQYDDQIRQLLRVHPENEITASGAPFWSGHRRCPHPIEFNPKNTLHMDYIVAAANLRAAMYGIERNTDREEIADMLESGEAPAQCLQEENIPEAVIDANPPPTSVAKPDDDKVLAKLLEELSKQKNRDDVSLSTMEFNAEDNNNFHLDFILASSNLRAANYNIEPSDRLKSKLIAGKVMPAIVTTASLVAGLASLELYKLAQRHDEPKLFKDGFVNLALPFFCFAEPVVPIQKTYNDQEFTVWDYLEVEGEITLREFLEYFQNKYKVNIVELSERGRTLYVTSLPSLASHLELSMSELVEVVSQKEIDPDKRFLVFDLKCQDASGQDVELPRVRYDLPR